jgi:hypothetical protein
MVVAACGDALAHCFVLSIQQKAIERRERIVSSELVLSAGQLKS